MWYINNGHKLAMAKKFTIYCPMIKIRFINIGELCTGSQQPPPFHPIPSYLFVECVSCWCCCLCCHVVAVVPFTLFVLIFSTSPSSSNSQRIHFGACKMDDIHDGSSIFMYSNVVNIDMFCMLNLIDSN